MTEITNADLNIKLDKVLNNFTKIVNGLDSIKTEQSNLKASIESIKETVKTVKENKEAINDLKSKNESLSKKVQAMETNIAILNQDKFKNTITMSKIPLQDDENIPELMDRICKCIDFPFKQGMLGNSYRVLKKGKGPTDTVVAHFLRTADKNMFLEAVKTKRGDLTHAKLKIKSSSEECDQKVFINEYMSADNYKIFSEARELKKSGLVQFVWFKHGHVFVRKSEGARCEKIQRKEELKKFRENSNYTFETDSDEFNCGANSETDGEEIAKSTPAKNGKKTKKRKKKRASD